MQRYSINHGETELKEPLMNQNINPSAIDSSQQDNSVSVQDSMIKKYMAMKPNPKFTSQTVANFKRRLFSYLRSSREVIMSLNPIPFCLIQIILIDTFLEAILKNFGIEADTFNQISEVMI